MLNGRISVENAGEYRHDLSMIMMLQSDVTMKQIAVWGHRTRGTPYISRRSRPDIGTQVRGRRGKLAIPIPKTKPDQRLLPNTYR